MLVLNYLVVSMKHFREFSSVSRGGPSAFQKVLEIEIVKINVLEGTVLCSPLYVGGHCNCRHRLLHCCGICVSSLIDASYDLVARRTPEQVR